ncbi:MAG: uracil phosphoribosyltransferase [bacterium]
MKGKVRVSRHPLVLEKIARLRDKSTGFGEFRSLMAEVSMLLGYEALSEMKVKKAVVKTPLGPAHCLRAKQDIIFTAILRAGLGMTEGLLRLEPSARLGHIGIYRNEETLDPVRYYVRLPNMRSRFVLLADPMLATGGSAVEAVNILRSRGAAHITFLCLIAAKRGLDHFHKVHPDVPVYAGAVDGILNGNGYIVPGLGDAGDRIFGTI